MQTNQMRYFLEIAKTKNISQAAENLYISQPALSQQVRKLEEELGIPLLIRHPKSVSLTDAGEQFVLHAERIINATDQLEDLMQKHSQLLSGTIRIGMPSISGYLDFFHLLSRFHDAMPGIHYELTLRISGELMDLLEARSIHAAFLIGGEELLKNREDLYYREIAPGSDEYMAMLRVDHPLASHSSIGVKDVLEERLIMPSRQSALYRQIESQFRAQGITPQVICETSQTDIAAQLAMEGLGIGFASRRVSEKLDRSKLAFVPLEVSIPRKIFYVTQKDQLDYPTIESFTSYVEHYVF